VVRDKPLRSSFAARTRGKASPSFALPLYCPVPCLASEAAPSFPFPSQRSWERRGTPPVPALPYHLTSITSEAGTAGTAGIGGKKLGKKVPPILASVKRWPPVLLSQLSLSRPSEAGKEGGHHLLSPFLHLTVVPLTPSCSEAARIRGKAVVPLLAPYRRTPYPFLQRSCTYKG
jgi:hypothetical protein